MVRLCFTAIAALALTGCSSRGPLHVPGQDYAMPQHPSSAQSVTAVESFEVEMIAMAVALPPPETNKPIGFLLANGDTRPWQVQTSTNLGGYWMTVQNTADRFYWFPDKSEPQRYFRLVRQ